MEKENGEKTVTFTYDPFGRRISKKVDTVTGGVTATTTFHYLYDQADIAVEFMTDNSGTTQTVYTHGPNIDEPLSLERDGQYAYYHADGLGSIVSITDDTGNIIQTYTYDSFGTITPTTSFPNSFTYTGREYDEETGLYFYRARYYDPKLGRFPNVDPIGFEGGDVNLYAYVGNNPIKRVDPWGLASCTYSISSHTMICTPNNTEDGNPVFLGPDGVWSGKKGNSCINNPEPECIKATGTGPIVPRNYNINKDNRKGKENYWRLEPDPQIPGWKCLTLLERCGFSLHPGIRSKGCITVDQKNKDAMRQYENINNLLNREIGKNRLTVVP